MSREETRLEAMGRVFAETFARWLPDSFVFVLVLTIIAAILSAVVVHATFLDILVDWYSGFWSPGFLAFTVQMCLIVVTAYAVGLAPPAQRFFEWLSEKAGTPRRVYLLVGIVSLVLCYISWSLLLLAALFGYMTARRVKNTDYRVVAAMVYSCSLIWHGGLSGSAPLMMNTKTFVEGLKAMGIEAELIPPSQTLFSTLNIVSIIGMAIIILVLVPMLAPKVVPPEWDLARVIEELQKKAQEASSGAGGSQASGAEEERKEKEAKPTPAEIMDRAWILNLVICALGFPYIIWHFYKYGLAGLNLNSVIFLLLLVGLALHKTPISYARAIRESTYAVANILMQFPFYAGIAGIFAGKGVTGHPVLAIAIAKWFASFATPANWTFIAYLCALILDFFITSGGGEWMVLAPIYIPASKMIGVPVARVLMAYAYADSVCNLWQPFWAVVISAPMTREIKLRARDFMGYTAIIGFVSFVWFGLTSSFLPI